jgi:hypothetical protein
MEMNTLLFDDMQDSPPKESKKSEASSGFTAQQLKMINWYAEAHDFRLTLSTPPETVNFIQRSNGEVESVDISDIKDAYKSSKKEEAQEKARLKRTEQPTENRGGYVV